MQPYDFRVCRMLEEVPAPIMDNLRDSIQNLMNFVFGPPLADESHLPEEQRHQKCHICNREHRGFYLLICDSCREEVKEMYTR